MPRSREQISFIPEAMVDVKQILECKHLGRQDLGDEVTWQANLEDNARKIALLT